MQEFSLIKKGYNPEEVDKYIGKLERTIEEYKEKDAAIAKAILNAQVAADNIIRNANAQAEDILTSAVTQLSFIHSSIDKQKQIVKNLQEDYGSLVDKYLKNVQTTDFLEIFSSINELENYLVSLTQDKDAIPEPKIDEPPTPPIPTHVIQDTQVYIPQEPEEEEYEFRLPTPKKRPTELME